MAIEVQTDRCIQPSIDGNAGSKTRACVPNGKKCQRSADKKKHPKAKSRSTSTQIVIEEAFRPTSIFADKLKNQMTYFTLVWWNVEGFDNYECVKSQMWKGPAISTTSQFLLCFTLFLWFILLALAVFGRGAGSDNKRGGGPCWG